MKLSAEIQAFCDGIGYQFDDPQLITRALTHASFSSPTRGNNQRLEFLGDRVLGLVISEALLGHDAQADEGVLAPRFNALVRKETCADVAREIGLGEVLKLGKSEMMSGGRRKGALLGDGMEALIAAVYLDGGLEAARDLILRLWNTRVTSVAEDARDAKTALQEFAQASNLPIPKYEVVRRSGPDHAPIFCISVSLESGDQAEAEAGSKRHAEQAAAKILLERLENG